MKRIGTVIAIVCITVILFSTTVSSCAEIVQPYASALIGSKSIGCSTLGDGVVRFTADLTGTTILDKVGFKEISIQEYSNGAWRSMKSTYNKYAYDTGLHAYSLSYDGTAGMQYRAYVKFYAEDGDISDTKTMYSPIVIAE